MRRQKLFTRVGALALAATMALSMAAPASVAAAGGTSADAALSQAADGKVSKVIGLEGENGSISSFTDYQTDQKYYYYKPSTYAAKPARLVVKGDAVESSFDKTTALYTYHGVQYGSADYDKESDTTTFRKKVLTVLGTNAYDVAGNQISTYDRTPYRVYDGDFYQVNGVLYGYPRSAYWSDKTPGSQASVSTYYIADDTAAYTVLATYTTAAERDSAKLAAARAANGTAVTDTWDAEYYVVNGKNYDYIYTDSYQDDNNNSVYYLYANNNDEIVFDNAAAEPSFSWNRLTVGSSALGQDLTADGKKIQVGYQVEVNGRVQEAADGRFTNVFTNVRNTDGSMIAVRTQNYYTPDVLLTAASPSATIRVRGVYYTKTETRDVVVAESHERCGLVKGDKYDKYDYDVIAIGAWSDAYTYTLKAKAEIPAVTDVSAVLNGTKVQVKWSAIPAVENYALYTIDSKVPLAINAQNFYNFYKKDDATLAANGITDNTTYMVSYTVKYSPEASFSTSDDAYQIDEKGNAYAYHYYAVLPRDVKDSDEYVNNVQQNKTFGNVASLTFAAGADVPVVSNLRIEKAAEQSGGNSFRVAWDVKDSNARVVVYAYRAKDFPAYYNKEILNAKVSVPATKRITVSDEQGNSVKQEVPLFKATYTDSSTNTVYSQTYYVENGSNVLTSDYFYTDDSNDYLYVSWEMLDAVVYTGVQATTKKYLSSELSEAERNRANAVKSQTASMKSGYVTFSDLVPGVTYYFVAHTYDSRNADVVREPVITYNGLAYTMYSDMSAASNKVSYKVQPGNASVYAKVTKSSVKLTMDSGFTGYEIYKMNKKGKYTKLATVNNNEYTDKEVELGKKYTYKVRPYTYNIKTKKMAYGDYSYVSAVPSAIGGISLKVTEKSKTSATLKWTKVAKATRYEIYRCDTTNYDSKVVSEDTLSTDKWELVKTIKKAKTVSYTDKKLKAGKNYYYIVRACYDEKGTEGYIQDGAYVATYATAPRNVKTKVSGTTGKISWDKDKFAAGYEVSYTIYNAYGNPVQNVATVKKTKKTSYSIKNIPQGGSAEVTVRSYDSDKCYASAGTHTLYTALKAPSGIKASYSKDKKAVKVSWKAVSGAKYYKVYRSTYTGTYDKDYKKYRTEGDLIAKEANDDYINDTVVYDEYLGITGSVTGTTAYDYYQLPKGVTYYYSVVAYGENGTSISSSTYGYASGKPAAYTSAVSKMTVKSVKNTKAKQVTIKFKKYTGASSYLILRSTKKNGKYEQIAKVSKKKTSYVDKTAKKGKTYYYKVVAVAKNGLKADMQVKSAAKKVKVKK